MKVRVSKEFRFEMAHALYGHDGPCKTIHGHSYQLTVTIIGDPSLEKNSKAGMIIDFSDLKRLVEQAIISVFDHSIVLNIEYPGILPNDEAFEKNHRVNFQPTCENLLLDFCNRLIKQELTNCKLHSMMLRETATSYAEWFASDN